MYHSIGDCLGDMNLFFNRKNGAYYCWEVENTTPLFIFSEGQYWGGITTRTRKGAFMYLEKRKFEKAGGWRKQSNGSIFIQSSFPERSGLVLMPSIFLDEETRLPISYSIFWAMGETALENLLISDNPTNKS